MDRIWFVYMIECACGTYYTGIALNVLQRFDMHKNKKGAKYFWQHTPKKIIYVEQAGSQTLAMQRERAIKKMSKPQKRKLLCSENNKVISK